MKRVLLVISGNVQGVFFRSNLKHIAERFNVKGYAKNTNEGNVEVILEGKEENVNKVIEFCKTGPQNAKVKKIDIKEEIYQNEFSDFSIEY